MKRMLLYVFISLLYFNSVNARTGAKAEAKFPAIKDGDICEAGHKYKKDCNICICSSKLKLLCTKMACKKDLSVNKSNHKKYNSVNGSGSKKNSFLDKYEKLPSSGFCKPGVMYRRNCDRCFCNENSKAFCVARTCSDPVNFRYVETPEDTRPPFTEEEFRNFPELPHASTKCTKGKAYRIACNTCLCLANGNLMCGTLLCLEDSYPKPGSKCEKYGNSTSSDCALRTINSPFSGHHAIDPKKGKCIPKKAYTSDCNKCYCQVDGSLRCTSRLCLNYSQVLMLNQHREYLEKHGQ